MRIGVPKEVKVHEYRVGLVPGGETQDAFAKVIKSDAEVYARIVRDAKITLN